MYYLSISYEMDAFRGGLNRSYLYDALLRRFVVVTVQMLVTGGRNKEIASPKPLQQHVLNFTFSLSAMRHYMSLYLIMTKSR